MAPDRLDGIREHVELYAGAPITDGYGPLIDDLRWLCPPGVGEAGYQSCACDRCVAYYQQATGVEVAQ